MSKSTLTPFSRKTADELIRELSDVFGGNVSAMADNYGRTIADIELEIKKRKKTQLKS